MKKIVDKQIIEQLISSGQLQKAVECLKINIEADPGNALWPFLRGKALWRQGDKGGAISDYERAAAIDPSSPAKQALEMSRDIMNFFNPDIFNP